MMKKLLFLFFFLILFSVSNADDGIRTMPIDCGDGRHFNYVPDGESSSERLSDFARAKTDLCN